MDGQKELWLDRDRLSAESLSMIAGMEAKKKSLFEATNKLLGIDLLQDNFLWNDAPVSVAKKLGWPLESRTENQSSYRYYPEENYTILGTRAYTCTLYGNERKVSQVSIIFSNKGDFQFSPVPTEDEIEAMEATIERDQESLALSLSNAFGEPVRQSFGGGGGPRERLQRWDWKGHAFLLALQKGEYVSLRIISSDLADNRGRGDRFSDDKLRKLTRRNVVTRENGDVVIKNIPMVDQGPKGYCVPATFERYLRYMQVPADMYLLAMAGQTQIGGGTYLSTIIEAVEGYLSSQNRSLERAQATIDIRTVKKYVDDGLPIIWTMCSSFEYNQYANQRTAQRQSLTSWDEWAEKLKQEERKLTFGRDMQSAHACMIIGYNEGTGEIAVSDSWGLEYEERWVSAKHADQVSQGSIYFIDF